MEGNNTVANKLPTAYLAGALRTIEDYQWRKLVTEKTEGKLICFTPPDIIAEKPGDKSLVVGPDWFREQKFRPKNFMTQRTDLFLIDQADIVLVNLLALNDKYPCIGSLVEMGYAKGKNKFILAVAGPEYKRHPFVAFTADGAFDTMDDMLEYLQHILVTVSGTSDLYSRPELNKQKSMNSHTYHYSDYDFPERKR